MRAINKEYLPEIGKNLSSLALPMAAMQFIVTISNFLCMMMLGRLGNDVLAASALIFSSQMSITVISMSILFSLSVLIGRKYGSSDNLAIGQYVQQGWILSILISIPVIFLFLYIDQILILFEQPQSLIQIVKEYFHASVWGVLPLLLAVCNQQLCYGIEKQGLVLITGVLEVILLLAIAYILVYGKLGFPKLGVAGLGYAMAAQAWFYFLFTTGWFYFKQEFQPFGLFHLKGDDNRFRLTEIYSVGWPISIQIGSEMLSFFVGASFIGWLGAKALAAYQVVIQYLFLIVVPVFALSQATGVLIGQAYGSNRMAEIKSIGNLSMLAALFINLFAAIILILCPHLLVTLYLDQSQMNDTVLIKLISSLFIVIACFILIDGTRNVLTGALRGLLDTKLPMVLNIGAIWLIGIPLRYLLGFTLEYGVVGMMAASTIGMLIAALLLWRRWQRINQGLII